MGGMGRGLGKREKTAMASEFMFITPKFGLEGGKLASCFTESTVLLTSLLSPWLGES